MQIRTWISTAMKNKDFCAFILSNNRANKVYTYETLRKCGYTGPIVMVIDSLDKKANEYKKLYGDQVYVFDKVKAGQITDSGDNFGTLRGVVYARNMNNEIAKELGYKYYIQLDDDYTDFRHKRNNYGTYSDKRIKDLDGVWDAMLDYFKDTPITSLAMAQGGDFIGGKDSGTIEKPKRKVMNSFIFSVDRPYEFFGRINEDVNMYVYLGSQGKLFVTVTIVSLQQKQTQKNSGGLTELYLDSGTYVKSFYSILYMPSSVKIAVMHSKNPRIHHMVRWRNTVPQIVEERFKKY